ncbi:MAG: HipA domain-containing protein [Rhodothermales bacterium]
MSRRCPLSYALLEAEETLYSIAGLRRLSPHLHALSPLPFSSAALIEEAAARADKLSIGGVQPKVSAVLRPAAQTFELVDQGGRYILKPEHPFYPELPANEDVTMRIAAAAGIETPTHGLIYTEDDKLCYMIQRFDRTGRSGKVAVEDFGQLMGLGRETKYGSSMERVASVLDRYATFPVVEKRKLFLRTLVAFLTGNEDMHVKNFSLIEAAGGVWQLSPAYDMVSTTLALREAREEMALPIRGKKANLTRTMLVEYFGGQRLGLPEKARNGVLQAVHDALPEWRALIAKSFLSAARQEAYLALIDERAQRLGVG